jgi:hypothetical protein
VRVNAAGKRHREGRQASPGACQETEKGTETALQASRRSYSETLPHQEPEVEGAAVDEHTFEDVVVAAKMRAPHTPGSVEVSEGPLGSFASITMQPQPSLAAIASTVGVHGLAADDVVTPPAAAAIRFGVLW